MGRVSTCQKNGNTIDLHGAQVNDNKYHKISNTRRTKFQNFNICLAIAFAPSIEARCQVEHENGVGAAPSIVQRCSNYIWVINKFITY